ncbi:MAG: galactose mutarotase [Muribaculaceae bacterium]|nr:galactose mutarotase [Muribaculaceae bacterium]
MKKVLFALAISGIFTACQTSHNQGTKSGLDPEKFNTTVDGKEVGLFTLTNGNGVEACITNYGGRLVSLMVPDRNGEFRDVVLGHDSIADYIDIDGNLGALIGRYGNRINQGKFSIDSVVYQLPQNDFGHCLHGGPKGFHHAVWDAVQPNDSTLRLSLFSPDGEYGFPGNVNVNVVYTLTGDNAVEIAYEATTDAPTILNLTNHSYFNLSGNPANDILAERLWIDAGGYTPIDSTFMTTGEIASVAGTPFDFTTPKAIGRDIDADDMQLRNGRGYDHNMVLRGDRDINAPAATLTDDESGIMMEMFTTEPGIQFYTGNFLDGTVKGKKGTAYPHRSAICLESQHYPDSPNKPQWPSVVVRPGEKYTSYCKYRFSVAE